MEAGSVQRVGGTEAHIPENRWWREDGNRRWTFTTEEIGWRAGRTKGAREVKGRAEIGECVFMT